MRNPMEPVEMLGITLRNQVSDQSSEEVRERLLDESLLKLSGEHSCDTLRTPSASNDATRRNPDFSSTVPYGLPQPRLPALW
ncbi:unnamed protein product [Parnassius apollo]|uniref:(apollo) hypothetical protein n=1 Tax=Parnassius apollo TaxID=110799 RepID=A0A8S3WF56_PARAO|nr:unnamed protein product [Parnassius apollo]